MTMHRQGMVMPQQILPSVFDRLFYPVPESENRDRGAATQFCEAVRRDLERLLNTRGATIPDGLSCVRKSVAAYGIDYLSPQHLATTDGKQRLTQQLATSIARFEPRLRNVTITPFDARSPQRLRFRIEANLLVNSRSERISFDSALEPATGALRIVRTAS
jgi:type VI secretion system protein ImpF